MGVLIEQYKALKPVEAPPDAFVFHEEGQPLDERSVLRYQLRPVVKALGLYFEGFGWHTFRRTHLTVLSEEGATAFETRDQAGHGEAETTMLYVKPSLVRRGAAAERVAGRLLPADCAGIVREKQTDASRLDAHLSSLLSDLVVSPWRLEHQTSTVSRFVLLGCRPVVRLSLRIRLRLVGFPDAGVLRLSDGLPDGFPNELRPSPAGWRSKMGEGPAGRFIKLNEQRPHIDSV